MSTKTFNNMVRYVNGIPIFERKKINGNEPFLNCVGRAVGMVRQRVTDKSPNSFLFIASNGKDLSFGAAGQEEDLLKGLVGLLDKNDLVREMLLTHYNHKKQIENGRKEQCSGDCSCGGNDCASEQ